MMKSSNPSSAPARICTSKTREIFLIIRDLQRTAKNESSQRPDAMQLITALSHLPLPELLASQWSKPSDSTTDGLHFILPSPTGIVEVKISWSQLAAYRRKLDSAGITRTEGRNK